MESTTIMPRISEELILMLADELYENDLPSLRSFARTCRRFYRLCRPLLFRKLRVTHARDVWNLVRIANSDEKRFQEVRNITINPATTLHLQVFKPIALKLHAFSNVNELYIDTSSSPSSDAALMILWQEWINRLYDSEFVSVATMRICILPNWSRRLKKCKLDLGGGFSGLWNIGGGACLFHAPSLEEFHVKDSDMTTFEPEDHQMESRATALRILTLEGCVLGDVSINAILDNPKDLEFFHFDENPTDIEPGQAAEEHRMFVVILDKLATHESTLEHLSVKFHETDVVSDAALNDPQININRTLPFDQFSNLKHLTINFAYLSPFATLTEMLNSLPESLKKLQIRDEANAKTPQTLLGIAEHISQQPYTLSGLILLAMEYNPQGGKIIPEEDVEAFVGIGKELQESREGTLRLKVYRKTKGTDYTPIIPLWEHVSESVLVYDSQSEEKMWNASGSREAMYDIRRRQAGRQLLLGGGSQLSEYQTMIQMENHGAFGYDGERRP